MAVPQAKQDAFTAAYTTEETAQIAYAAANNGDYEQKTANTVDGIEYQTHKYEGPNGKGFVFIGKYNDGSDDWITSKGYGNEDRESDWTKVVNV